MRSAGWTPRQHRQVDLDASLGQPCVGGNLGTLFQNDQVARHQFSCLHRRGPAVADHQGVLGQVLRESLHRLLGLPLLDERERRVDENHGDDRPSEHGNAGDERQRGGRPEQQSQGVDQLPYEFTSQ